MSKACNCIIEGGLVFLLIFTPLAFGTVHNWAYNLLELVALFMVIAWFVKMIYLGELRFVRMPLNIPIIVFFALILLQLVPLPPHIIKLLSPNTYNLYKDALPNYDAAQSWRSLTIYPHASKNELFKFLTYTSVFLLVVNNLTNQRQIKRVLGSVLIVGLLVSFLGILQKLGGTEKIYWFLDASFATPFGTFFNRNHFAGYIGMVIPLGIFLLIKPSFFGFKKNGNDSRYLLAFFMVILMAVALFLSLSRGGITTFFLSLIFLGILMITKHQLRKNVVVILPIAVVLIIALIWIGIKPVEDTLSTLVTIKEEGSAINRLAVWRDTVGLIKDFPILGTGLGTFACIFPKYCDQPSISKLFFDHAHNDYLELFSDMGIAGFLTVMIMFFLIFRCIFSHGNELSVLTLCLLAGIVSMMFHSITDFNLRIPSNALLFATLIGLAISAAKMRADKPVLAYHKFSVSGIKKFAAYPIVGAIASCFLFLIIGSYRTTFAYNKCLSDTSGAYEKGKKESNILETSKDAEHHYGLAIYYTNAMKKSQDKKELKARSGDVLLTKPVLNLGQKAIKELEYAINLSPAVGKYHARLAWTYAYIDRLMERSELRAIAAREFERAITLDHNNAQLHRLYAAWLFDIGNRLNNKDNEPHITKATSEYRHAVSLDSSIAEEALAAFFRYRKDYDGLKMILPDTPEAYYKLAAFLQSKGLWEQNKTVFIKHAEPIKNSYFYCKAIANGFALQGKYQEAISLFMEYVKKDPRNADAHFWIAEWCSDSPAREHEWKSTAKHYQDAIRLDPENTFFHLWYGIRLFQQGQYEIAIRTLNTVAVQDSKNAKAYFWMGRAYESQGRWSEAMGKYEKAVLLSPADSEYRKRLIALKGSLGGDANFALNPSAEVTDGHKVVHWNYFRATTVDAEYGPSKEAHSGKKGIYLRLPSAPKDSDFGGGIIQGDSNGYSGQDAYPVRPSTTYHFRLFCKGDVPSIAVKVIGFNSSGGFANSRQEIDTTLGTISPASEWREYQGTFRTLSDTERAVLMFYVEGLIGTLGYDPGKTLYIDDVYIGTMPISPAFAQN